MRNIVSVLFDPTPVKYLQLREPHFQHYAFASFVSLRLDCDGRAAVVVYDLPGLAALREDEGEEVAFDIFEHVEQVRHIYRATRLEGPGLDACLDVDAPVLVGLEDYFGNLVNLLVQ